MKGKQLDFAIQQLTGMHYSEGRNVRALCIGMALDADEWPEIKRECHWLSDYEVTEIEDYLQDVIKGDI
jgi:hypothetical protein